MKRVFLLVTFAVSFFCRVSAHLQSYEVKSPDKMISFKLNLDLEQQTLLYKITVD